MGWTTYHRPAGESDRDHLQRELCGELHTILDCVTIKTTFYAAVRDNKTDEVWGLVVLQQRTRGEFNYGRKDMTDTMGPAEDSCPDRILDLLSPTDSAYANQWRTRCREGNAAKAARPKVRRGDTVKFARPLKFSNGDELDTFTFLERSTFRGPGMRYRITSWRDRQHTVVPA